MNLIMPEWPYDLPQYLLLNIAVGGYWGGQEGIDDTIFPRRCTPIFTIMPKDLY